MTRIPTLDNPLLLGFDQIERMLDRVSKTATDGYPPYNIEKMADCVSESAGGGDQSGRPTGNPAGTKKIGGERIRIVLAVAGFTRDQLEITVEDSQLSIRGSQDDTKDQSGRVYLHRGIAARRFLRTFVLADGYEVRQADLEHGLLTIDIARPEQTRQVRRIEIQVHD